MPDITDLLICVLVCILAIPSWVLSRCRKGFLSQVLLPRSFAMRGVLAFALAGSCVFACLGLGGYRISVAGVRLSEFFAAILGLFVNFWLVHRVYLESLPRGCNDKSEADGQRTKPPGDSGDTR